MDYKHLDKHNETYKTHKDLIERLNGLLDDFEASREDFNSLVDYYYSDQFRKDFEDSNQGKIGDDINQGLLTEDTIYDLIGDDYYLALRLLDLANKMIQK